jgi:hypothetical protein
MWFQLLLLEEQPYEQVKHYSLEKTVDVGGISFMRANTLGVTTTLNQGKVFPIKTKKVVI